MATRTYVRMQSEELVTSLQEAAARASAGDLSRDDTIHLLLSAHEMIAEQNKALRRGSELLAAAKELERLLKKCGGPRSLVKAD